jgi:hypothetical protein
MSLETKAEKWYYRQTILNREFLQKKYPTNGGNLDEWLEMVYNHRYDHLRPEYRPKQYR